ncbi:MAG: serine/threonine protein phosphatase [Planctomycetales bacterium]|nr:serine/threonine protein phosphatase [Planctomycetales bacterium]
MPARMIAIGDIHGCSRALETVLEAIGPTADDLFVPLGDYVDRGPNSKGVIDMLLQLETTCQVEPILGNHEEMMMMVLSGHAGPNDWLRYGGVATLDSYGFDGDPTAIPDSHRDFFQRCRDYFEADRHFFVHANYRHDVPLPELDAEMLRWQSLINYTPGPHQSGKIAVCGHTPDKYGEIMDMGYLKCIDTYCYGGQWLTALDLLSGQVWQANEKAELRA